MFSSPKVLGMCIHHNIGTYHLLEEYPYHCMYLTHIDYHLNRYIWDMFYMSHLVRVSNFGHKYLQSIHIHFVFWLMEGIIHIYQFLSRYNLADSLMFHIFSCLIGV